MQAHLPAGSEARFDFQKYIQRSLEEDFKVVVGIRSVSLYKFIIIFFNNLVFHNIINIWLNYLLTTSLCVNENAAHWYGASLSCSYWLIHMVGPKSLSFHWNHTNYMSTKMTYINFHFFLEIIIGWASYLWLPFIPLLVSNYIHITSNSKFWTGVLCSVGFVWQLWLWTYINDID